jgi:hypothetical protein
MINAIGDPNISPRPRELLNTYSEKVVELFFTDPWLDQVRPLLQSYAEDVTSIFDVSPPEPEKQLVKDFRDLTQAFEKAVIGVVQPPEPE